MVESVKAASDVYAPVSGEVVEANGDLAADTGAGQRGRRGQGLVLQDGLANPGELDALMDRAAYEALVKESCLMRYLPLTDADRQAMLAKIGVADIDALFADVPADKLLGELLDLPRAKGELEVERELGRAGRPQRRRPARCRSSSAPAPTSTMCRRRVDHLIQRSEFLTSYTPYQPEIAQGTLQYLFEFQTQVAMLTGMEVANASMYDGSTAAAEAVLMAHRVTKRQQGGAVRQPAPALPRDHRDGGAHGGRTRSWRRCRTARRRT